MNSMTFLLSLIDASEGSEVQGRTLLQKRAYFVSLLSRLEVDLGFDAHYYGPFSATVEGTVAEMKNLGFLQEASTGFGVVAGGFEMRRYDYCLTEDGRRVVDTLRGTATYEKIKAALAAISAAGDPNYMELSIAAKAYYILRKNNKPMTVNELGDAAKNFKWQINSESLERAIKFLRDVGLTQ